MPELSRPSEPPRRASGAHPAMPADEADRVWWRDGVLYQIYPRSYMDANGDGIGDLRGIEQRLDHLEWLGIDGVWLSPISDSPDADFGYDVSDYCNVNPALGTLGDAESLIAAAARRNIRVLLDIVPNHTSDRHPWFVDAASSRRAVHRDFYVWADPSAGGGPPNNWVNTFNPGIPAWTYHQPTGQYYLNQFLPSQPDLNWWDPRVRDEFDRIYRFWFDRGVAGFRIDVCHAVVKDRELRDNPPNDPDEHWYARMYGQKFLYNTCRPEVHDVIRRWRAIADSYDPHRVLVGETYVLDPERFAAFYGNGDELNLAFNLMFLHASFDAAELRGTVEFAQDRLPDNAWPTYNLGSHDNRRFPSRWAAGDPAKARAAMVLLMGLRGTPLLYYGDEIGMPDTPVPADRILDPVGLMHGERLGRDPERTPMHWEPTPGAGFSPPGVETWLPLGDAAACNVADQRNDPASFLHLTRDLVALRRDRPDLRAGAYRTDPRSAGGLWVWQRGRSTLVVCNLSPERMLVPEVSGRVLASSVYGRAGEAVTGTFEAAPWEATIIGW